MSSTSADARPAVSLGFTGAYNILAPYIREKFIEQLVEESGVLLLPASIYGSELNPTPPDRFRIGLGRTGLDEGLAAFDAHIRRNHG